MTLEHTDISSMLETAVVAARLAGQRAMEEINYTKSSIKNNSEIVTAADAACQKLIIDRIRESYPDHGFIAEEGEAGRLLKWPPRGSESIWWIIDPIDGTNNYSHGLLNFAVSIGAFHEGRPVVAAIFDPATDSMYTAAKDMDAQLNYSRIAVSTDKIDPFSSFGIDSHFTSDHAQGVFDMIHRTRFRNLGSTAIHFAYVAKGAMIGALTTTTKLWDIAAGVLLIERAGGRVSDLDGKSPFPVDLDNYNGESFLLLATNSAVHDEAMSIFNAH